MLARPICTVSFSVVAGVPVFVSIGGSQLLALVVAGAAPAGRACAGRAAGAAACVGTAGGAATLFGGSGGLGTLLADAGLALSGRSTALPDAVCSADVVAPVINSCCSVL